MTIFEELKQEKIIPNSWDINDDLFSKFKQNFKEIVFVDLSTENPFAISSTQIYNFESKLENILNSVDSKGYNIFIELLTSNSTQLYQRLPCDTGYMWHKKNMKSLTTRTHYVSQELCVYYFRNIQNIWKNKLKNI